MKKEKKSSPILSNLPTKIGLLDLGTKISQKGFTLIELLVVVAIIGLLSTLSILALNTARARARDARRVADVKQIQTALEMYYNDAGVYPSTASAGNSVVYNGSTFLKTIPKPPTTIDGGSTSPGCGALAAAQPYYTYVMTGSGASSSYTIQYCLGAAVNDIPLGMNTATPAGIR